MKKKNLKEGIEHGKFLTNGAKIIETKSEKKNKFFAFSRNTQLVFWWIVQKFPPLINYEAKISQTADWFCPVIFQFGVNNFLLPLKILKRSYGLANCIFDNPDEKILLKVRSFCLKWEKKIVEL